MATVEELIEKHEWCDIPRCPLCYAKSNREIQKKIDEMNKK